MSLIIDSCSLINLVKAGLAEGIREDACMRLQVGPVVSDEVWGGDGIDVWVPQDLVSLIDRDVDGAELAEMMDRYRIGPGEAESIILARDLNRVLFCDDKRGRRAATEIIGEERVVGTLGLALQMANEFDAILAIFDQYDRARSEGAFLPFHTSESFHAACGACREWPCDQDCEKRG